MKNIPKQLLVWLLAVLMVWPWPLRLAAQSQGTTLNPEEMEQLVAPIALYPDALVSQILIASTYPLEIVQAERWAKANTTLKGEALTRALEAQSWDPSVKSLVNFPQVLAAMSEKLDVTLKLGDAFLAQQKDVLNAIQRLRARAQAQGTLKTTKEQTVIVEQPAVQTTVVEQPAAPTTVIRIEPTDPQVVYVPTYNPTVVYGAWPYPAYPPYSYYPYYPYGYVAAGALAFTAGVALAAAWGYAWGGCNWHGGDVDIDVNRNTNLNRNINRENTGRIWKHGGKEGKGRGNMTPVTGRGSRIEIKGRRSASTGAAMREPRRHGRRFVAGRRVVGKSSVVVERTGSAKGVVWAIGVVWETGVV